MTMLLEMFLFFDILSLNVVIKKVVTHSRACTSEVSQDDAIKSYEMDIGHDTRRIS